jgi:DNA-binding PadR family transcriptional regulator
VFGHHPPRHPFFFGFGQHHRWSDAETPFDFGFGKFGRRFGQGFGSDRPFGRGDLKYVILELLKDQPRHGYDIIRALEERSRGMYRPSPGSVYPTLQMLEDLGYVTASQQDGKKVYAITDEGRRYLTEQESTVDDIRSRVTAGWDTASRPELAELMHEMQRLARALFREATRGALQDPERLKRLKAILERARTDVEIVGETPKTEEPKTTVV